MARKQLGELALRVNDLPKMKAFYRDVVGLEVFNDDYEDIEFVFFKAGEGVPGHPTILGMFDRSIETAQPQTTLDHFAFIIDLEDYGSERARLESLGIRVMPRTFEVFGWRALFFTDPEGNTVEFVAYDPSVA